METTSRRSVTGALIGASLSAVAGLLIAAPAQADVVASDFQVPGESAYFFVSPSEQWDCAIVPATAVSPARAGCTGSIPDYAPNVVGGGNPSIHPNSVSVSAAKPAQLGFTSDVSLTPESQAPVRTLEYGQTLTAAGISCSIDPAAGVTCEVGGHAFTVSTEHYELR